MHLYSVSTPQPQSWGPIELGYPSVCHSFLVRAKTFEQKVIAVIKVIGTHEKGWRVDVSCDRFSQILLKYQNCGFSKHELIRARTFERYVIETRLYA